MEGSQEKYINRRLRTSSLSTILSISLVLLMLSTLGFIVINSQRLSNYIKENVGLTIILQEDIKEVELIQFQKKLDASYWVKSTEYVDKKDAAKTLENELGEDFITFLGFNPLSNTIDVFMNAQYANNKFMTEIERELMNNSLVKDIELQKDLINAINNNVQKLSFLLLSFSFLLLVVAVALINNTIRLTVYSKRFVIRSMKLVGATHQFIRKPFITSGIFQGFISGLIGVLLTMLLLFALHSEMPEIILIKDLPTMGALLMGTITFGILISSVVTVVAVNKYLKMNEQELYH